MEILSAIIGGLVSGATPTAIYFLRKLKKEKKLCVSRGLATGYYHNFISKIFSENKINFTQSDKSIKKYETDKSIFFEIIFPSELSQKKLKDAETYESSFKKGILNLPNRDYPINYRIETDQLYLVDFPSPLSALNTYVKNLNLKSSKKLFKRKKEEKENFKNSIIDLVNEIGYGQGRISFKDEKGNNVV